MLIYISGPITGIDGYLGIFWAAELKLQAKYKGARIFNPASAHQNMPEWLTHDEYMQLCRIELGWCDVVYFLRGWKTSKGASMEHEWAIEQGKKILYEDEEGI